MSSGSSVSYGFGLVLVDDELESFNEALGLKYDDCQDCDLEENLQSLEDEQDVVFCGHEAEFYNNFWDGKRFQAVGSAVENAVYPEKMLAFRAAKTSTPFKAAYKDVDEVAEEFRYALGKYLPKDFDYAAHIGWFACS